MKKKNFILCLLAFLSLVSCHNSNPTVTEFNEPVVNDSMLDPDRSKVKFYGSFSNLKKGVNDLNLNMYLLNTSNMVIQSLNDFSILNKADGSKISKENYYVYDSDLGTITKENKDVNYMTYEVKAYFCEVDEKKDVYFEVKRNGDDKGSYANIIDIDTNKAVGTVYFIEHGLKISEKTINNYLTDNLMYV